METDLIVITTNSEYHLSGDRVVRAFDRRTNAPVPFSGTLRLVNGRPTTDRSMHLDHVDDRGRWALLQTSPVILAA